MKIKIPISMDFSVGAVNYMLDIAQYNKLGPMSKVYYEPLVEGLSFSEWGIVCENGVVYSGAI